MDGMDMQPALTDAELAVRIVELARRGRNVGGVYFALAHGEEIEESDESAARVLRIYQALMLKGAL